MNKLELKHIAPYLPYRLQIVRPDNKTKMLIEGVLKDLLVVFENGEEKYCSLNGVKPILRPLSSMTEKESDEIEDIIGCNFYIYASGNGIEIEDIIIDPWGGQSVLRMETLNRIYEWLFAHHFDVFNLIENNLAIDKTKIK